jgi:DNA-binding MarR family transcriptional regulator
MAGPKKRRTALFDAPDWADTVAIRLMVLGDKMMSRLTTFLVDFGVTPLQFNVLRILYVRDPDHEGLTVGSVGGALVTPMSDITRLVDRLEKQGLVERLRAPDDRRVVRVRLTDDGFALVEKIHKPLLAHHNALLEKISKTDLQRLAADLARVIEQLPKTTEASSSFR